jgi:hypothetical protein
MRIIVILTIIFISNNLFSQCDCCYTHLFYDQNELVSYFPKKSIQKNDFIKVIITESEIDTIKNIINELSLAEVQFDKKGNYTKYIGYYNGIYNHRIDYKRKKLGEIKNSRMVYLDSLGSEFKNFGKMPLKDYKSSWFKSKIKTRNYDDKKMPNNESSITLKKTDFKGREKLTLVQLYTKDAIQIHLSKHLMKTEYYAELQMGIRTHTYQDTISSIDTIYFNKDWKMLEMRSYYMQNRKFTHYYSGYWKYDINGNRIHYNSNNPTGIPNSECSDRNDFELKYEYYSNNLLKSVYYTYEGKTYQIKCKYE